MTQIEAEPRPTSNTSNGRLVTMGAPLSAPRGILIADSNHDAAHGLVVELMAHGISATVCSNGAEALFQAASLNPDVILISASMPLLDSADFIQVFRARRHTPILVGMGTDDHDQALRALQAGATACVPKPYRFDDIIALLRSSGMSGLKPVPPPETILRCGCVELNVELHEVRVRDRAVPMPLREFELLRYFLNNAGRLVTHENIKENVWGTGYAGETNTVTVHIRRLRRRLDDFTNPKLIQTIRGLGYRFACDDTCDA